MLKLIFFLGLFISTQIHPVTIYSITNGQRNMPITLKDYWLDEKNDWLEAWSLSMQQQTSLNKTIFVSEANPNLLTIQTTSHLYTLYDRDNTFTISITTKNMSLFDYIKLFPKIPLELIIIELYIDRHGIISCYIPNNAPIKRVPMKQLVTPIYPKPIDRLYELSWCPESL